jgi:hypothetical protein
MKQIILAWTFLTLLSSCTNELPFKPKQSIFLFKDKDGVYLYDPTTEKEKNIFKATDKQIFLVEPYQFSNDTLTFSFCGELINLNNNIDKSGDETYYKEYFSIALKTGNRWLSKKINYSAHFGFFNTNLDAIKITTMYFNSKGDTLNQTDTTIKNPVYSFSFRNGVCFNYSNDYERSTTVNNKYVFSYQGNIYLVNKTDTTILVKNNKKYYPKDFDGYCQPQLHPAVEYMVFCY